MNKKIIMATALFAGFLKTDAAESYCIAINNNTPETLTVSATVIFQGQNSWPYVNTHKIKDVEPYSKSSDPKNQSCYSYEDIKTRFGNYFPNGQYGPLTLKSTYLSQSSPLESGMPIVISDIQFAIDSVAVITFNPSSANGFPNSSGVYAYTSTGTYQGYSDEAGTQPYRSPGNFNFTYFTKAN